MSTQRGNVMNRSRLQDKAQDKGQDKDSAKAKSKKAGSLRYWSELQLQALELPKKKKQQS